MWLARPVDLGWPLGAPPEVIAGIFFKSEESFFFWLSRNHISGFAVKIICASVYRKWNNQLSVEK